MKRAAKRMFRRVNVRNREQVSRCCGVYVSVGCSRAVDSGSAHEALAASEGGCTRTISADGIGPWSVLRPRRRIVIQQRLVGSASDVLAKKIGCEVGHHPIRELHNNTVTDNRYKPNWLSQSFISFLIQLSAAVAILFQSPFGIAFSGQANKHQPRLPWQLQRWQSLLLAARSRRFCWPGETVL